MVIGDTEFIGDAPEEGAFLRASKPCLATGANRELWLRMIRYLAGESGQGSPGTQ